MGAKPSIEKLRERIHKLGKAGLRDGVSQGGQPDAYMLAAEIVRTCIAHRQPTPYGFIFTPEYFGIDLYSAWNTDTARAYFAEHIVLPDEEDIASPWVFPELPSFERAALDTLGPQLIVCDTDGGSFQFYEVDDPIDRTCHPIRVGKQADMIARVSRLIAPACQADHVPVSQKRASAAFQYFQAAAQFQPAPLLLGQRGDVRFCLHRQNMRPDPRISFPHIQQFLDRLADAEAYSAFWYGTAFGLNLGRQALYIHDPEGQGGKSKILKTTAQALFGERIYTSFPPSINLADRFTLSHFVGKKLVLIGDCKDSYVLHRGIVKELLGDDKSHVQHKFEQPFSTHLECRLIIASNNAPFIIGQKHNTTRTLFLSLAPLELEDHQIDPFYGEKCLHEIPGWLSYAEDCYRRLCKNNYNIQVNDRVKQDTAVRIAACESEHSELFDEHFVVDDEGQVTSKEWNQRLKDAHVNKHEQENLLQWTMAMFDTELQLDRNGRSWLMDGIRLRGSSDNVRASQQRSSTFEDAY